MDINAPHEELGFYCRCKSASHVAKTKCVFAQPSRDAPELRPSIQNLNPPREAAMRFRKALGGQRPQTLVYLPSEPGLSRITWHRALGWLAPLPIIASNGVATVAPGADGGSAVIGASPRGAPVTVS